MRLEVIESIMCQSIKDAYVGKTLLVNPWDVHMFEIIHKHFMTVIKAMRLQIIVKQTHSLT